MTMRPDTASRIPAPSTHDWHDGEWMERRATWQWMHEPMSVYEVHPGSWRRKGSDDFLTFRELADQLGAAAVGQRLLQRHWCRDGPPACVNPPW